MVISSNAKGWLDGDAFSYVMVISSTAVVESLSFPLLLQNNNNNNNIDCYNDAFRVFVLRI